MTIKPCEARRTCFLPGLNAGASGSLLPCGRCRQVLLEAGGAGLLVDTETGPVELERLLPSAFTGADLPGAGGAERPAAGERHA
jgi:cytidine deaminase